MAKTSNKKSSSQSFFTSRRGIIISTIVILIVAIALLISSRFYHGDKTARSALNSTETVNVIDQSSYFAFIPTEAETTSGFILYPGAFVDADAYAPLMSNLANQGIPSFIAKMPFDLAILKGNIADIIINDYPNITDWYIGGHSLGGVAAANYASEHPDLIKGIAFLASYPNTDLSGQDIKVVSIYGSNDTVLNTESYEEALTLLPSDPTRFKEVFISGGNHANFGSYGNQSGDTPATIPASQQQQITADAIVQMINE